MLQPDLMEKIVSLCKRRGFIFPGSEIYSGIAGFYDYGPLGVELKNNIKKEWWKTMVWEREDIVGLDSSIIMNPKVWEASGHVEAFTDPLIECWNCHARSRTDQLVEIGEKEKFKEMSELEKATYTFPKTRKNETNTHHTVDYFAGANHKCPDCQRLINLEIDKPRQFNLLMKTYLGTVEGQQNQTYLRGETCQGIYLNFINIVNSTRQKIPFGAAQIGKAFRNEITPGNFTFRTREFEQMEMEFFIKNDEQEAEKWFAYWKEQRLNWYLSLGIKKENIRFKDHAPDERAHYAKAATDCQYNAPFGWSEFEGIHHRGDWDLSRHSQYSGKDLSYFDEETRQKYTPWIIETSAGADRSTLFFLLDAYEEEQIKDEVRIVLHLNPKLAPFKAAIFPLVKDEKLKVIAQKVYADLKKKWLVFYDETSSIGRRYRRQDEIGTPFCITVDFDSLEDNKVTVRDRDTLKQERISINEIGAFINDKLS